MCNVITRKCVDMHEAKHKFKEHVTGSWLVVEGLTASERDLLICQYRVKTLISMNEQAWEMKSS